MSDSTRKKSEYFISAMLILAIGSGLVFLVKQIAGAESAVTGTVEQAVIAYSNSDFKRARKISASLQQEDDLARLIYNLSVIYDTDVQDYSGGMRELKVIFEDENIADGIRAEAMMTYARIAGVFQYRNMSGPWDGADVAALLRKVISIDPAHPRSCTAVVSLMEEYYLPEQPNAVGGILNYADEFVKNYAGNTKDTVHVDLAASKMAIDLLRDYDRAYKCLKRAYDTGISKPLLERLTLLRLGRISEVEMNDPVSARKYYTVFLEKYPNARRTPVVKKYLKELNRAEM